MEFTLFWLLKLRLPLILTKRILCDSKYPDVILVTANSRFLKSPYDVPQQKQMALQQTIFTDISKGDSLI